MAKDKKTSKIEFVDNDSDNVFTDIIQINVTQETINLDLALRNKDNQTADVSHSIYMTIPHFLRFTETCKKLSKELIQQLEEADDSDNNKS